MKRNSSPSIRFPSIQHHWITSIGSHVDFTISHFDIPVVKCFDTPTPSIRNLHQKVFFAFRHFDISTFLVVKCFDTPIPGIQNLHQKVFFTFLHFDIPCGEVFWHSNSRYPKPTPKGVFRISAFWHFDIPCDEISWRSMSRSPKWSLVVSTFLQLLTMWPQPMITR